MLECTSHWASVNWLTSLLKSGGVVWDADLSY